MIKYFTKRERYQWALDKLWNYYFSHRPGNKEVLAKCYWIQEWLME